MSTQLQKFDSLKAEISVFVQPVSTIVVTNQTELDAAMSTVRTVKHLLKQVEARKKELIDPLNAQVKLVRDYANEIAAPLEAAEAHVKAQLVAYERELARSREEARRREAEEQRKREAEARAKLEEERKAAELEAMFATKEESDLAEATIEATETRVHTELAITHAQNLAQIDAQKVSGARKVWTFKVTDLSLVPKEFFVLDEKKVRSQIRDGVREISGIEIFQETSIAIR